VDFDNTLVTYDKLLAAIARERGLIDSAGPETKRALRDRIRLLPDGENEWQRCQAALYGRRISEARLIDGVPRFFQLCRENSIPTYIVSHKTEFSAFDPGVNLRSAALEWMAANGFFDTLGLSSSDVFFAGTRAEKIERVRELHCTHFIDDLEETFLEPAFPSQIEKLLYEPGRQSPPPAGAKLVTTWQEISEHFFGHN
jgi:hypothetical protein